MKIVSVKSIILTLSVAVFMIVMSSSFARDVDYTVKLPKGYSAHFYNWKGDNKPTLNFTDENGALRVVCNLPDEAYWMTEYDNELIAFMDTNDNVYICLVWDSGLAKGFSLWSKDISSTSSKWVQIRKENLRVFSTDNIGIWKHTSKDFNSLSLGVYKSSNMIVIDRYILKVEGHLMEDGRIQIERMAFE